MHAAHGDAPIRLFHLFGAANYQAYQVVDIRSNQSTRDAAPELWQFFRPARAPRLTTTAAFNKSLNGRGTRA
jgi:hypothetical protein